MQSVHPSPAGNGQPQEETEVQDVQPDGEEEKRLANITAAAAYFEAQRELGRQAYRNGEPVSMMFGEFEAEGWHEAEQEHAYSVMRKEWAAAEARAAMYEYRPGNAQWQEDHAWNPGPANNWCTSRT